MIAAGIAVAAPTVASAGVPAGYTGNGVNIRAHPTTSATIWAEGYEDQTATAYCYTSGTTVTLDGLTSNIWIENHDDTTGYPLSSENGGKGYSWIGLMWFDAIGEC